MPVLADLPPRPPVICTRPSGDAFGTEGGIIFNAAQGAAIHWEERAEWLLQNSPSSGEELDYNSIPLKIVGQISVHCDFIGPLKPMPYEWDE